MGTALESLSHDESKRKSELVAVVKRGMATFVEVGKALAEIRDAKLYRDSHKTFELFCESTFDIKKSHAYRLIEAAAVDANLSPMGDKNGKPTSERQTRELAKAPEEKQAEAWEQAVGDAGGEQPTAKQVAAAVEKVTEPEPEKLPTDTLGLELPAYLIAPFGVLELFQKAQSLVSELRDLVHEIGEHPGGLVLKRDLKSQGTDKRVRYRWDSLEQIKSVLAVTKPYTRCPYCESRVKSKPPKDCKHCGGCGWCTKRTYDSYAEYEKAVK